MVKIFRSQSFAEKARIVAAKSTHQIVLRRGEDLNMWVGCGYPKSGTVWLCQLMGAYLDLPYPRLYQSPILMPSVIHAHWGWDPRLTNAIYIRRDGRDVLTSVYFYCARRLSMRDKPAGYGRVHIAFERLFGPGYDVNDVAANLPVFIESELETPVLTGETPWHHHVREWWGRPSVHHVAYEDLVLDAPDALTRLMTDVTGRSDPERAARVAAHFDFVAASGRRPGEEDRSSFLRKGVAGDWVNHFSPEARQAFDMLAGDALVDFGFEPDRSWVDG